MVFRQCSIGGRCYTGDEEAEAEEVIIAKQSSSSEALPKFKTAIPHFKDAALQADLDAAFSEKSDAADAAHARLLNGFLSCLVCEWLATVQYIHNLSTIVHALYVQNMRAYILQHMFCQCPMSDNSSRDSVTAACTLPWM